jgi:hypothetical protein
VVAGGVPARQVTGHMGVLNEGITMCWEINQFTQNVRQHNLFILE